MRVEIVPAIIPEDLEYLKAKIEKVKDYVKSIQIDVVDGRFAPPRTWPFVKDKQEYYPDFAKMIEKKEKLPYADTIEYEFDLMLLRPGKKVYDFAALGPRRIIIHIEGIRQEGNIIKELREKYPRDVDDDEKKLDIGLALNPRTENEIIDQYMEHIDFVQFMGNDKVGYHGVQLDEEKVLEKIKSLRSKHPVMTIAVDIGVNLDTAKKLAEAGANKLVSGSAIFGARDIKARLEEFNHLVNL